MKVLISGMTSRQTNRDRNPLSVASLLHRALEADGHDVTMQRLRSVSEPLWDYDAVILGLASPLSPSARYTVTTLSALQDALESGTLKAVFVDDPDIRKLWYGTKSVIARPDRLWSDYYIGRPGVVETSGDEAARDKVMGMLDWVQSGLDGTVQFWWPAHPWASDATVNSMLLEHGRADQASVGGLDLTPVLLGDPPHRDMVSPGEAWVEDMQYSTDEMVFDPSSTRYSMQLSNTHEESVERKISMYQFGYGVVQGLTGNTGQGGWWTPTPALAALAGRLYVPSRKEAELMGGPYYHLPSDLEYLDVPDEYSRKLQEQAQYLKEASWSMEQLLTETNGVLGA